MSKCRGITLLELLSSLIVVLVACWLLHVAITGTRRARDEDRRIRCRNNLAVLAHSMGMYIGDSGGNRFYSWPAGRPGCGTSANPSFGGAEWLANLYWTWRDPPAYVFLCPASSDTNQNGDELGTQGTPGGRPLPGAAVSYAAMGDVSVGVFMASKTGKGASYAKSRIAPRDDFPSSAPMACDDTEEPINHGSRDNGGMNVLFFDSHVEWWSHERVDLERGVGAGELVHLRN